MKPNRLSSLLFLLLIGCRAKPPRTPATPLPGSYLDLEPGWRLRVITPLVRGGSFQVKTGPVAESGNTLAAQAAADFEGYETAYYDVLPQAQIRFRNAEALRNGQLTPQPKPVYPVYTHHHRMTVLRIVYLKRASETTHDMAILAARDLAALNALTTAVQSTPEKACQSERRATCQWVPAGIAVRAESRKSGEWQSVR